MKQLEIEGLNCSGPIVNRRVKYLENIGAWNIIPLVNVRVWECRRRRRIMFWKYCRN